MPDPVPPERGGLSPESDVTPRPHSHLVAGIMEARDCSKPEPESATVPPRFGACT